MGAPVQSNVGVSDDYLANKVGSNFATISAVGAASIMIINPALNVKGAVLRTWVGIPAAGAFLSIYTGTAAPASYNDTSKPCLALIPNNVAIQQQQKLYLPPGYGLWVIGSAAGNFFSGTYDVL